MSNWPRGVPVYYPPQGDPAYQFPHPVPEPYPQVLRTWAWPSQWWRAVVGIVAMAGGMFLIAPLVAMPVLAIGIAIQSHYDGTSFSDGFSNAFDLTNITPASMLWLNLSLAGGIPISMVLIRWLHHLRPRWLMSVQPGIRWRFFWICVGLSAVALAAQITLSQFVPSPDHLGGGLNPWTGTQVALTLVILLTTPLQAMAEEYCFRGYLMQAFGSLFGTWVSVVVTAVLFALAHGVQNPPLFFDRFAFGLIAGILVVRSGGLEAGIALHILNNYAALGIAVVFGDLAAALNVSTVPWSTIPLTIVQNGLYLILVWWVVRRLKLRNRTEAPVLVGAPASV